MQISYEQKVTVTGESDTPVPAVGSGSSQKSRSAAAPAAVTNVDGGSSSLVPVDVIHRRRQAKWKPHPGPFGGSRDSDKKCENHINNGKSMRNGTLDPITAAVAMVAVVIAVALVFVIGAAIAVVMINVTIVVARGLVIAAVMAVLLAGRSQTRHGKRRQSGVELPIALDQGTTRPSDDDEVVCVEEEPIIDVPKTAVQSEPDVEDVISSADQVSVVSEFQIDEEQPSDPDEASGNSISDITCNGDSIGPETCGVSGCHGREIAITRCPPTVMTRDVTLSPSSRLRGRRRHNGVELPSVLDQGTTRPSDDDEMVYVDEEPIIDVLKTVHSEPDVEDVISSADQVSVVSAFQVDKERPSDPDKASSNSISDIIRNGDSIGPETCGVSGCHLQIKVEVAIARCSPTVMLRDVTLTPSSKINYSRLAKINAKTDMQMFLAKVNTLLNGDGDPSEQRAVDSGMIKYWLMRTRLFSRFSRGILLDEESFYSVCPEVLSEHIARKCKCSCIIDPFCGAGGNVIQFTKTCDRVIGIDFDSNKIKLAENNAKVYGVQHRLEFRTGDYFRHADDLRSDVVYMSPPWGGPEYLNKKVYRLADMCVSYGGGDRIIQIAREIAPKIAIHLPRHVDKNECVSLAEKYQFKQVLFENNYVDKKLNSVTLFLK